ncbi:hypothetical protein GPZ77_34685 (plasmid) [Streptomyces sp. QHH-9511]|uniref:hypothetical protein n=1 Tax=Streptomyces sp. QHH-9511 TaxID=2684468 RepID=UPI001317A2DF|nr:hypothetical protein [Streptomyces sp. QHH-9511]QGZ53375.1 hypothetical protein GPZ77_34685 [Streptomyces sp. QHH-9511]
MADTKIGELLDSLEVTVDLDEGDLVADALVLLKVVKADGTVALLKAGSASLDWLSALGMLTAALEIENSGYQSAPDEV